MLLELAIGDAYGAGFEYARPDFVRKYNDLSKYVKHQKHDIPPGHYTDDTQMSIAVAEAMAAGVKWNEQNLANWFVTCFKRDVRPGYAGGFYKLLKEVKDGDELRSRLKGNNRSDKSGGAMRALPLGFLTSINEIMGKAEIQARITHDTPDGIHAAQAAALMGHYFIKEYGPRKQLGVWINSHVKGQWATPYEDMVGAQGWMSVRAAITAITKCASMSDLLRTCIAFTGDVDTVATLALGAASMCDNEMIQDIPEHLIDKLEDGTYGRRYLEQMEGHLVAQTHIPF